MAFYKYGFAFLAGTGFGAALTSLRRDGHCPLHRRHHRRRRHDHDHDEHIAELEDKEAAGEERYMRERESKGGDDHKGQEGEQKAAAAAAREEEEDDE